MGSYTAANDDGWFLTTCDAFVYRGVYLTDEERELSESLGTLELTQPAKSTFLVGWGGYADASNGTPDDYLAFPADDAKYEIDMIYVDFAATTVASIVTAATVALAMF